jgi:hypothetical protein
MSAMPALSRVAERLRERTAPLAPDDEQHGWAHALLCGALAQAFEQVADIFDPPDPIPPGAPLLDVTLCPDWALPWLAQIVGVQIPNGAAPDQARALIADIAGWQRGTPGALRAAARAFLSTPTATVYFNERLANDAYRLGVLTLISQTPDPELVRRAIEAQKPGGIVLSYAAIDVQTYRALLTEVDSYREARATWPTYRSMRAQLPAGYREVA